MDVRMSYHPPASASAPWYAAVTLTSSSPFRDIASQGRRTEADVAVPAGPFGGGRQEAHGRDVGSSEDPKAACVCAVCGQGLVAGPRWWSMWRTICSTTSAERYERTVGRDGSDHFNVE
jgi:hypothetical protein